LRTAEQIRAYKAEWARKNRKPLTEEQKAARAIYFSEWRDKNADKVKRARDAAYERDRERIKARSRDWHHANKDRASERSKQYRDANAAVLLEKKREYWDANRDQLAEKRRLRFRQDPEYRARALARAKSTKAKRKGAEGSFTAADIESIYQSQSGRCAGCGLDLSISCQADHKLPLSRGGTNWPSNIQLLCQPCNRSKGAKTPEEWKGPRRAA
jgi:5-methylcytosine-specific restriction endonuclease McrA